MKYEVRFAVEGRVVVNVEADSPSEAEVLANEEVSEMDFGELFNIEWETVYVEDERYNRVK